MDKTFAYARDSFLATLTVSERAVRTAMMRKGPDLGTFTGKDQRGRFAPKYKTPANDYHGAKCHIASSPAVESHYCGRNSARKYLDLALSVKFMWKGFIHSGAWKIITTLLVCMCIVISLTLSSTLGSTNQRKISA